MSLESSIIRLCRSLGIALDSAAPKEIKSTINSRAIWGGIVMAIPLFGLDWIIYAFILWTMYSKVAEIAGIKFSSSLIKNVLAGFIINLVISGILNFFLDFIAIFGWIGMFFVGYISIRYSGIAYLGILEMFHGSKKMRTRLDYNAGQRAFEESGGIKAAKGVVKSTAMNEINDAF